MLWQDIRVLKSQFAHFAHLLHNFIQVKSFRLWDSWIVHLLDRGKKWTSALACQLPHAQPLITAPQLLCSQRVTHPFFPVCGEAGLTWGEVTPPHQPQGRTWDPGIVIGSSDWFMKSLVRKADLWDSLQQFPTFRKYQFFPTRLLN